MSNGHGARVNLPYGAASATRLRPTDRPTDHRGDLSPGSIIIKK